MRKKISSTYQLLTIRQTLAIDEIFLPYNNNDSSDHHRASICSTTHLYNICSGSLAKKSHICPSATQGQKKRESVVKLKRFQVFFHFNYIWPYNCVRCKILFNFLKTYPFYSKTTMSLLQVSPHFVIHRLNLELLFYVERIQG